MEFIKELKFDSNGLIPAIIQDYQNGEVLMLGYMNEEALRRTLQEGKVCFWSRSRRCLWLKGETSGNFQIVKEIYFDCDGDALLIKVDQKGGACHLGYRSCFFRKITEDGGFRIVGEKVFDPDKVYA
ncbi:phosphoribosyl-AMP cyclohydrolase [Candidatus Poribacteria bacterium]|nr:phosphoribosyl-AMP cyclohydrolase [Candidatus Poribacteria bacterium]